MALWYCQGCHILVAFEGPKQAGVLRVYDCWETWSLPYEVDLKQEESEPHGRRRSKILKDNLSGLTPLSHSALPLAVLSENAFQVSLSAEENPKCLEGGKVAVAVRFFLLNIQQN